MGPGDFLFGTLLGEGAYAKVVHVRLKPTGGGSSGAGGGRPSGRGTTPEFAVKVMEKRFIKKENKTHFIMMERNIMSRVLHPNVVRLVYTFQVRTAALLL